MSEWLTYPENKPEFEGREYIVRAVGMKGNLVREWDPGWRYEDVVAFLPTPIPKYEPVPPPTTIEWERIPIDVAYGQRAIVLIDGKPEPAWRGELGWRRAGVFGAPGMIYPGPVWWEKRS